jgi:hypothetical protein
MLTIGAEGFHALKVRLGHFLGLVIGMAHLVSLERTFSANLTLTSHGDILLNLKMIA